MASEGHARRYGSLHGWGELSDALDIVAEPRGVLGSGVEGRARLEELVFAVKRIRAAAREEFGDPCLVHRLEGSCRFECLFEVALVLDAGDHHGGRQV